MSRENMKPETNDPISTNDQGATEAVRSEPADLPEWELVADRSDDPLLSVRDLRTYYDTANGTIRAVDGVSFDIQKGEILGLVGESGCGKSTVSRSIVNLIQSPGYIDGGEIHFRGRDLLDASEAELRKIRGNDISMIFQEPMSALNPVYDIGWQVGEPLRIHENLSKKASRERAADLMGQIGIPNAEDRVDDYPHEFSGGMLQRATVAMALACGPELLIADEPTTALDVSIQAQMLNLIRELNEEEEMAVLLVTHDLGVIAETCDRVAVMYAGRIVEVGDTEAIFRDPRHPYTRGLLNSVPDPHRSEQHLKPIGGEVPHLVDLPDGCNFANRCDYAVDDCRTIDPRLREVDDGHYSACIWEDPS